MPSSPERPAAASWVPTELTASTVSTHAPVAAPQSALVALELFEVSAVAGIPDAVLAPARLAAESAGYVAGWNSGQRAAAERAEAEAHRVHEANELALSAARARVEQAVAGLLAAAHAFDVRAAPTLEQVEHLVVETALALAEAVVGRVLADEVAAARAALHRALDLAPDGPRAVVAMNPADHDIVVRLEAEIPDGVEIVVDPALAPGDSLATCGATTVDARVSAGLARARALLGGTS